MSGPLTRWWRSRLEVLVAAVVCLAIIAVTVADTRIATEAQLSLNTNWRGAYDILVTAPGEDFGGARTGGLVDANFVSTAGHGGITVGQLDRIRALENIDVAAPVGLVGTLQDVALTPSLILMDDPVTGTTDIEGAHEVLRLTSTLSRQTALGIESISKSSGIIDVSKRSAADVDTLAASPAAVGYPNGFSPQSNNLYYQVSLGALPAFPSSVIAIDPVAEMKLMGSREGAYLKPLLKLPQRRTIADGTRWASMVDSGRFLVQQTAIEQAVADDVKNETVLPLLVNSSVDKHLTLTLSIERASEMAADGLTSDSQKLKQLLTDGSFSPPTLLTKDVSSLGTPFSSPDLSVMLPGSELPQGESAGSFYSSSTGLAPELAGRPQYERVPTKSQLGSRLTYRVQARGIVRADGTPDGVDFSQTTGQNLDVGTVQSYRKFTRTDRTGLGRVLPAPIGQFANHDLEADSTAAASYVPSGLYDGAVSRLVATPDGSSVPVPKNLEPNLSGLDFITAPPGAFTDLAGGKALRGTTPIDAVRVRVAGISSYSTTNRKKVDTVAAKIANLGLNAIVVAGSSPQPVSVYVPKYKVAADGTTEDLGWVRQDWTTLGAAVTVSGAISGMQLALIASSLGAVLVAFFSALLLAARRRRSQVQLLRDVGWTNRQLRRYLFTQQIPGAALVTIVALCCMVFGERGLTSIVVSALIILSAACAAGIGVASAFVTPHQSLRDSRRSKQSVVSLAGLGMRHLYGSPGVFLSQVVGLAAIGGCVALTYGAIATGRDSSGDTRLGGLVFGTTAVAAILLGAAGVLASLVLAVLGRRSELARRKDEEDVFASIGYSHRAVSRMNAFEAATVAVAAVLLTTALAVIISASSNLGPSVIFYSLVSSVAGFLCVAVLTDKKLGKS